MTKATQELKVYLSARTDVTMTMTVEAKNAADARRQARRRIAQAYKAAKIDLGWIDEAGNQLLIAPSPDRVTFQVAGDNMARQTESRPVPHCYKCKGQNVVRDSWAEWDKEIRMWSVNQLGDHARCHDCDAATEIEWRAA